MVTGDVTGEPLLIGYIFSALAVTRGLEDAGRNCVPRNKE